MTPAELRTLRERLGLSGEALGALLERAVTDRTVRRWEAGALPIPADAAATVLRLDALYERAVREALGRLAAARAEHGGDPEVVHLVRYWSPEDLARAHPDLAPLGPAGHAALVGRVREALVREGVPVRIVAFDPDAYHTWRGRRADTVALRAEWAAEQLASA
jgi:hypothetical protein